jgi:predicted transposase/invertase (TIGR01784 family)
MAVLWLRFLTEINTKTEEAPAELLENPDTAKALKILERSAYTEGQLIAYDRFWDAVYRERVFYDDGFNKGKIEGRDEGLAEGRAEGRAEGIKEANRENARRMKADGMPAELIAKYTGLTVEAVNSL